MVGKDLLHGCALFLTVALACPCPLDGQERPVAQPGVRVRLLLHVDPQGGKTARVVGTLMRLGPDSVAVYDQDRLAVVTAALDAARRLEVSRGRRSHVGRGALLGLVIGGLGGVATGLILCSSNDCSSSGGEWAPVIVGTLGLGGGLAGTGLGALVGSLIRSERWETVPLGR